MTKGDVQQIKLHAQALHQMLDLKTLFPSDAQGLYPLQKGK